METAYPVDFSRAYEKNSGCAAWKLELCSSSAHSVPAQMIIALTGRLQCIQIKRIWPRMQWAQLGTHISRRRAHIQNNQGHQRKPNQCKNNWIAYPNGAQTSDFSSIRTRYKHCKALLTTEQQVKRYQQPHLMELWSNAQIIWP